MQLGQLVSHQLLNEALEPRAAANRLFGQKSVNLPVAMVSVTSGVEAAS